MATYPANWKIQEPLLKTEDSSTDDDIPAEFHSFEEADTLAELLSFQQHHWVLPSIALPLLEHASDSLCNPDRALYSMGGFVCGLPRKVTEMCCGRKCEQPDSKRTLREQLSDICARVGLTRYTSPQWVIVFAALFYALTHATHIKVLIVTSLEPTLHELRSATGVQGWIHRLLYFTSFMVMRLFVTTLIPFLSPAFAVLIEEGMPENQKQYATIMLLTSACLAGGVPWMLDRLINMLKCKPFTRDVPFTKLAFKFVSTYPATCWVPILMEKTAKVAKGYDMQSRECTACALAVAHTVPFGGAGASLLGRLLILSLVDNMLVQPFGMLEDCGAVMLSTAQTRPILALESWILFLAVLNVLQVGFAFQRQMKTQAIKNVSSVILLLQFSALLKSTFADVPESAADVPLLFSSKVGTRLKEVGAAMMIVSLLSSWFGTAMKALMVSLGFEKCCGRLGGAEQSKHLASGDDDRDPWQLC